MALTVTTRVRAIPVGDRYMTVSNIVPDNSFASGGESLTRADLGFSSAADDQFTVICSQSGGWVFDYDYTNQKLLAYMQTDSDNNVALGVADSADASATTVVVTAYGRYRN